MPTGPGLAAQTRVEPLLQIRQVCIYPILLISLLFDSLYIYIHIYIYIYIYIYICVCVCVYYFKGMAGGPAGMVGEAEVVRFYSRF